MVMAADGAYVQMSGSGNGAGLSIWAWVGVMAALTIVAGGIGGVCGVALVAQVKTLAQTNSHSEASGPQPTYGRDVGLLTLPPIVTNLASPANAWARLQAAIVYNKKAVQDPKILGARISQDILAYLKTVTVAQIGGASGLEHLREDLNERAAIRSKGRVHSVIIETLVVQ